MTLSQPTNVNQQTTNAMHSTSRWRAALVRQGLMNDQCEPTRSGAVTRAWVRPPARIPARAHDCNSNHCVGSRWRYIAWPSPAWPKKVAQTHGKQPRAETESDWVVRSRINGRNVARLGPPWANGDDEAYLGYRRAGFRGSGGVSGRLGARWRGVVARSIACEVTSRRRQNGQHGGET